MKNILLGIITINLTFISANLALRSVEPVQAEDQRSQYELQSLIERTVSNNCYTNHYHNNDRHDHSIRKHGSPTRYSFSSSNESINIQRTKATITCD